LQDGDLVPGYYDKIKQPMCFHSMRTKLQGREYRSAAAAAVAVRKDLVSAAVGSSSGGGSGTRDQQQHDQHVFVYQSSRGKISSCVWVATPAAPAPALRTWPQELQARVYSSPTAMAQLQWRSG
jgi:hypothetical protein